MAEAKQSEAQVKASEPAKRFVTLDELTTFDATRDIGETYLERYDAWIKYKRRVSLQFLLATQRRFVKGKRRDTEGYMVHVLQEIMLEPAVQNEAQARALVQADGALLIGLVGEVMGTDLTEGFEEAAEEAGE